MSKQEINKDSLRAVLARMALNNPNVSTAQAKEAQRILKSIKDTKPILGQGSVRFDNHELDTSVKLQRGDGPKSPAEISFTTETGYERPDKPNTKARQLGIRAAVNQGVDQLPTARDGTKRNAYYEFEPIEDMKDFRNRRVGQTDNQRAKMYRRFSNGAMNAVLEPSTGSMVGRGERISDDTFQPRGEKGRLQKHVKWNLGEPVKRLDKIARQVTQPLRIIANAANRANPYLLSADLIQQDIKNSSVADGTLANRTPAEMGVMGPPAPKPKSKSKLAIKAPPKKNTAVLAKKGGKTGSSINGLFIAHPWSAEQRNRYAARGGK